MATTSTNGAPSCSAVPAAGKSTLSQLLLDEDPGCALRACCWHRVWHVCDAILARLEATQALRASALSFGTARRKRCKPRESTS